MWHDGCVHYKQNTLCPKLCIHHYNVNYWNTALEFEQKTPFQALGGGKKNIHRLHYQRYAIFVHHFVSSTHHSVNHQSSDPESTCLRHIQHLMGTGWAHSPPSSKHYNHIHCWVGPLPHIYTLIFLSCINLITHISLKRQTSIQKITK